MGKTASLIAGDRELTQLRGVMFRESGDPTTRLVFMLGHIHRIFSKCDTPGSKECVFAVQRIQDIMHKVADSCKREVEDYSLTPFAIHNIGISGRESQLADHLDNMRQFMLTPNRDTLQAVRDSRLSLRRPNSNGDHDGNVDESGLE